MKHTQTPWAIEDNDSYKPFEKVLRGPWEKQGDGKYIAYINGSDEDANFIVRAVNNHYDLIAAARLAFEMLSTAKDAGVPIEESVIIKIQSTINKSEGK